MFVRLVLAGGVNAGMVAEIKEGFYLIGRHQECQIRPESDSVSDRHCLLQHQGKHFRVFVLDEDSPTLVNHKPLKAKQWRWLNHGDMLQVGRIPFMVVITATDPALPAHPRGPAPGSIRSQSTAVTRDAAGDSVTQRPVASDRPPSEVDEHEIGAADEGSLKDDGGDFGEQDQQARKRRRSSATASQQGETIASMRRAVRARHRRSFGLLRINWRLALLGTCLIVALGLGVYGGYRYLSGEQSNSVRLLPDLD